MSGRNSEIVRDALALLSQGKINEATVDVADDAEWDATGSMAVHRIYRGREEMRRGLEEFLADWESWTWDPEEVTELDSETVLAVNLVAGRGRTSGVQVSARGAQLWRFRDGAPHRITLHQSREEAVHAYRAERVAAARLYFVCEARPRGEDPSALLDAAIAGGAGIIQLREKELDDEELVAAAAPFRAAADRGGALFILNDRPDLVAACGADGVHVGQADMPVAEARRLAGPGALVGLSSHAEDEIAAACAAAGDDRPDQLSVGPVWETPTKEGRPAAGLGLVEFAAREATIPWFAIGGIDVETAPVVARTGARRAVVVRAIRDADDPEAAARAIGDALAAPDRETPG
jgi:thiamine-phosphate pyrophosphorylase